MKLVIVSGLSGSGKSIVLQVLEDLEYYCIDNLPVNMLDTLLSRINSAQYDKIAISIDARNISNQGDFQQRLQRLKDNKINYEVFFLEASDTSIIQRFSETRRKHPLSNIDTPLNEAVVQERKLLEPISSQADLRIDTSSTHVHQLRDLIKARVSRADSRGISIMFESFGFKHGVPIDADFVFDVRCLANPHWVPELKMLTGLDTPVANFLSNDEHVNEMINDILLFLEKWLPQFEADNRSYITIAVGCTGGQHRSVYIVEALTLKLTAKYSNILTRHRELD